MAPIACQSGCRRHKRDLERGRDLLRFHRPDRRAIEATRAPNPGPHGWPRLLVNRGAAGTRAISNEEKTSCDFIAPIGELSGPPEIGEFLAPMVAQRRLLAAGYSVPCPEPRMKLLHPARPLGAEQHFGRLLAGPRGAVAENFADLLGMGLQLATPLRGPRQNSRPPGRPGPSSPRRSRSRPGDTWPPSPPVGRRRQTASRAG